jgi:uncharacterized Fe-S cluster-containing MiaB family protein
MQITKKQLKQIISEEAEHLSEETARYQQLIENYASGYGADEESVPKEALIDLLEVIEEERIPREAFELFVESLNENKVTSLLSEVLEAEQE